MSSRKYRLSPAEREYFRRRARAWRRRNPEKARLISREAQKKYRVKMKAKGYRIGLSDGKWKWIKDTRGPRRRT
jgi:hypothetical protein